MYARLSRPPALFIPPRQITLLLIGARLLSPSWNSASAAVTGPRRSSPGMPQLIGCHTGKFGLIGPLRKRLLAIISSTEYEWTKRAPGLLENLEAIRVQHRHDLPAGAGWVELPTALTRKYPNAGREWVWQWCSPPRIYRDRLTGQRRRHHLHESVLQRAVKAAVRRAGPAKRASPHTLRHSSRRTCSRTAHAIRTVQELLGHRDVTTTMIYTHVLNRGPAAVRSPADRVFGP